MDTAVIISTYNSPVWLEKVLWGYQNQKDSDFKILIADDGSGSETKDLIDSFRRDSALKIEHIWHEDIGFRKTEILNKAILSTNSDYLIFTDGDCIPRNDMVGVHKKRARRGCYLSAGYYKLTLPVSRIITKSDIVSQKAFNNKWLTSIGQPKSLKALKLANKYQELLNYLTPARATWNGANSSGFKADIMAVNGFDERMKYGGEDVEMGERMINKGFRSIQIRYSAICVHLDHERSYVDNEMWDRNNIIREEVASKRLSWSDFGIVRGA